MAFGPWQFGTTEAIAIAQIAAVLLIAWWAKETAEHWIKKRAALRKAEVAEKTLALMYEADDVFRSIRSRLQSVPYEELNLEGREKIDAEYKRGLSRIQHFEPFFKRVIAHLPITKALLGDKIDNELAEILRLRNEYFSALDSRRDWGPEIGVEGSHLDARRENLNKLRRVLYGSSDEDDEFYQRYKTALKNLEDELFPMIRGEEPSPPRHPPA